MGKPQDAGIAVVLTALPLEYRAVRDRLTQLQRTTHARGGTGFELGRLPDSQVRIVLLRTGDGNAPAAVLAERAIASFDPRALIFVGVAGALKDELALGDVVVASRVYAPHGGKEEGGRFLARPRAFEAPHELLDLAQHLSITRTWTGPAPDGTTRAFAVHFKPVAAGEVVLNSRTTPLARQLRSHYNDAAAIEMESAGVAQAAVLNRSLPALTVRGISDRADGDKPGADAAGWQPIAAADAALFALELIREWLEPAAPASPGEGTVDARGARP
jgi:nucleoside phosphorylase